MTYTGVLMFGAIPPSVRPEPFDKPIKKLRSWTMRYLQMLPGPGVFKGNTEPIGRRTKHICLVAFGVSPDGERHVLHATYPGCAFPNVRVFNDNFDLALQISLGRLGTTRLTRWRRRGRALAPLLKSKKLDRMSDYFCEQGGVDGLAEVYLTSFSSYVLYDDGTVHDVDALFHAYDCLEDARIKSIRYEPVRDADGAPTLREKSANAVAAGKKAGP